MANRTCMVASDEEDEDGNLLDVSNEGKTNLPIDETFPKREVVYLTENTEDFEPEDVDPFHVTSPSELAVVVPPLETVGTNATQILPVQGVKVQTPEGSDKNVQEYKPNVNQNISEQKAGGKTTGVSHTKAAALMPPPLKKNAPVDNYTKKAKYARQATPICDAIMKEYSKRQRMTSSGKHKSQDLTDSQIQELLEKSKKKSRQISKPSEKPVEVVTSLVQSRSFSKNTTEDPVKDEEDVKPDLTTLPHSIIVKQDELEIVDVKPEISTIPLAENQEDVTLNIQNLKSNYKKKITSRRSRRKKRKFSDDDDDDDDDDDPLYSPSPYLMPRASRRNNPAIHTIENKIINTGELTDEQPVLKQIDGSAARNQEESALKQPAINNEQPAVKKRGRPKRNSVAEQNVPDNSLKSKSSSDEIHPQEYQDISNPEASSVAARLKMIADRITNVLSNEGSPNVAGEAECLLKTTQELLKLQKETEQHQKSVSEPIKNSLLIKQEKIEMNDDFNCNNFVEFSSNDEDAFDSIFLNSGKLSAIPPVSSQRRKASTTKSLNKNVKVKIGNDQTRNIPSSLAKTSPLLSKNRVEYTSWSSPPMNVQEKCSFVTDYFKSYQHVFDTKFLKNEFTLLCDLLQSSWFNLTENLHRYKNALHLRSDDLRQQEIKLVKQSHLETAMQYSIKFVHQFNNIVGKITQTNTSKALMTTFIFYLIGSVLTRVPKCKQGRVKNLLMFLLELHRPDHPLVWQVLQAPNNVYEEQVRLLVQLLKYFQKRDLISIPSDKLLTCYFPDTNEDDEFQSIEQSLMSVPPSDLDMIAERTSCSTTQTSKSSKNLSVIANEFAEALQSDREDNVRRIEEKLDSILKVLREKSVQEDKITVPLERMSRSTVADSFIPQGRHSTASSEARSAALAPLLEDNNNLDSLFNSYENSSTNDVEIKSEPLDFDERSIDVKGSYSEQITYHTLPNGESTVLRPCFVKIKREEVFITEDYGDSSQVQMYNEDDPLSSQQSEEPGTFCWK